jgi:multidrug resistance efflux pump
MNKKMNIVIILAVAFIATLSACGSQPNSTTAQASPAPAGAVIAEGHIRPTQSLTLAFQGRGVVKQIAVQQGDQVKEGDVLAILSDAGQAQAQMIAAQQAYDLLIRNAPTARAQAWQAYMNAQKVRADTLHKWNNLDINDIERRMKDAQITVNDRQAILQNAQAVFDQNKNLDVNNFDRVNAANKLLSAQKNLDEAVRSLEAITRERDSVRAALDAAQAAEAEAKYQYQLTDNGPNNDQLELAKAQLDSALETLHNFELIAPFDGVVADVSIHLGDQVGPETAAVSVANFNKWIVETDNVNELEVVKLAVGNTVKLMPDALPGVTLNGEVESISQTFTKQGGDILYTVVIKVENVDTRIRWGMTVEATFPPLGQ